MAKKHVPQQLDTTVLIIGGGPTGLTLAGLLGQAGLATLCVDRDPPDRQLLETFDGRTTAVALGSQRVLAAAGVWEALAPQASAIREIRTADQNSPLFLHFDHRELGRQPFGWIVENRHMRAAFFERLAALDSVDHIAPATVAELQRDGDRILARLEDGRRIRAELVVRADGGRSMVRNWAGIATRGHRYRQDAIVCVIGHEAPHGQVAVEHFQAAGPFAVLPMADAPDGTHRSSIVWTEHRHRAGQYLALDEAGFTAALQRRVGDGLGRVWQIGARFRYPLRLLHARRYTAPRLALIGEAAHVIHPIAGQGLNMGFRDAAGLAETVVDAARLGLDPGGAAVLDRYSRARRVDNQRMILVTDALNRLFSNDIGPIKRVRDLGLAGVGQIPPLKRFFMSRAMGIAADAPRLVRGESL